MNNLFIYILFGVIVFLGSVSILWWFTLGWNPGVAP